MSDNNHSIVCHNNEDSASGGSGSSASLNNDSETSNSSSSSEDTSNAKKRKLFEKSEKLHLTLENFDSDDIPSDYPYVLTSPRSLAACKHFAVRVSPFLKIDLMFCIIRSKSCFLINGLALNSFE